jgi:hypothetical protein
MSGSRGSDGANTRTRHQAKIETPSLPRRSHPRSGSRISDCVIMVGIAAQIVSELKIIEGGTNEVHFTVFHTFQMLKKLQADYDAVYSTDKPMPL